MAEKERRRRHSSRAEEDGSGGGKSSVFSFKAVGIGMLVIFVVCSMQFMLLTRHVDHDGHVGGYLHSMDGDATVRQLGIQIATLTQQQKDLLRLSDEFARDLQKQHNELKQVEAAIPSLSQVGAASESQARELDQLRQRARHLEEQLTAAQVPGQPATASAQRRVVSGNEAVASQTPLTDARTPPGPESDAGFTPHATAAAAASVGASKFPAEWLKRFSEAELQASANEADRWRLMAKNAFLTAWKGYKDHAWGADEFNPSSGQRARVWANCGLQILDSLSTMWIMGLTKEFDEATEWVENHLQWSHHGLVSFFEITIRALGGLASAHSLSGREVFLRKAKELADRMLPAFQMDTGFPYTQVNLQSGQGSGGWFQGTVLAEAGTVQLEFRYISQQTGDPKYGEKADKSMRSIITASRGRGLVPWGLSRSGPPHPTNSHITLGAMGDSYYEYLLKMWLQTDKTEAEWKEQWKKAMNEMEDRLILKTDGGLTYVAEENMGRASHKMDHLACFVGGMLVYGARTLPSSEVDPRWEESAAGITETCYQMYHRQPSHLAPECVSLRPRGGVGHDMDVWNNAAHYLLRPEAAEAIFYMFYYTGDPKYRRWAGEIMEAIEDHTKTTYGYSAVHDVRQQRPRLKNEMETFFLAETLKYLYLTFLPNPREVLSLDEFVFTTEAHPLRIKRPGGQDGGFLRSYR